MTFRGQASGFPPAVGPWRSTQGGGSSQDCRAGTSSMPVRGQETLGGAGGLQDLSSLAGCGARAGRWLGS